jgi:hypothetical protein
MGATLGPRKKKPASRKTKSPGASRMSLLTQT